MSNNIGLRQRNLNPRQRDRQGDWNLVLGTWGLGRRRPAEETQLAWSRPYVWESLRSRASVSQSPAPRLGKLPAGLGIALLNLGLLIAPVVMPTPAQGAQRIYLIYGPIEFSLPVKSLA